PGDHLLARFEDDGDLDPTFGTGGVVVTDLEGGSHDVATAVAVQPDDKIVVAGTCGIDPFRIAVTRYEADGSLDTNFGTGGHTCTTFPDGSAVAYAVALQSDGKIVVAGNV